MSGIERQKRMERTVAEWVTSGLSAEAMAGRAGISESTLWRWKSRLERARRRRLTAAAPTSRFLPVRVVQTTERGSMSAGEDAIGAERGNPFELVFPDGARLVIPSQFAADALAEILAVLRTC